MITPIFETERLYVRHFQPDDIDVFAALCIDPVVMRYVGDGETLPREMVSHWIDVCQQKYANRGNGTSAVFEKAGDTFIGYCGVVRASENDFDELIYVFNVAAWGKGYASEVGRAMLRYVFNFSTLERIYATIYPENLASIKVIEKIGVRFDHTEVDPDGKTVNFYMIERNRATAT